MSEIEKKDKPLWVAKSNDLIRARWHLTIAEQRVILICLSKIMPDEVITTKTVFEITAMELAVYTGASRTSAYRDLKSVVKRLYWNNIYIGDDIEFRWITYIRFGQDKATAQLTFSEQILPFITELKKKFTVFDAKKALYFKSAYALQIYELLVQFPKLTEQKLSIAKIREYLLIDDGDYKRNSDFKSRVIDPAIKDINSLSNISVTVETVTEKKVAIAFRFKYKVDKGDNDKSSQSNDKNNSYSAHRSYSDAYPGENLQEYLDRKAKELRNKKDIKK
jgi:plasmid replication initiation protein